MCTMIKILLLLALVMPIPSVSTTTAPAQASPQTMQLSSWQFESFDGTIAGGTQSVTIVNPSAAPAEHIAFPLGIPPCTCTLVGASMTDGVVDESVWTVDTLAAGATVSLELVYETNA